MDPALGLGWDVEVLTAEQETSMNIVRIGLDSREICLPSSRR